MKEIREPEYIKNSASKKNLICGFAMVVFLLALLFVPRPRITVCTTASIHELTYKNTMNNSNLKQKKKKKTADNIIQTCTQILQKISRQLF